jgi:hypothetical protein
LERLQRLPAAAYLSRWAASSLGGDGTAKLSVGAKAEADVRLSARCFFKVGSEAIVGRQ